VQIQATTLPWWSAPRRGGGAAARLPRWAAARQRRGSGDRRSGGADRGILICRALRRQRLRALRQRPLPAGDQDRAPASGGGGWPARLPAAAPVPLVV